MSTDKPSRQTFSVKVNGTDRRVEALPETPILYLLRNDLHILSPRYGCGGEQCGACQVQVDGVPRASCTLAVGNIDDAEITTLEGLNHGPALRAAFLANNAGQCGYCLAGILVAADALLQTNPRPGRAEIMAALDGHLCRCGSHNRIIRSIEDAAR